MVDETFVQLGAADFNATDRPYCYREIEVDKSRNSDDSDNFLHNYPSH
jgi:hypothetical protein